VRVPSRATSRPGHIVCPTCGAGVLRPRELHLEITSCDSCGLSVEGAVLRTLEQIITLPEAEGAHPCECGHPEMRHLPDRVFHCPACGSEVLPPKVRRNLPGSSVGNLGRSGTASPSSGEDGS
jgi:transcription elongation factor Elf1